MRVHYVLVCMVVLVACSSGPSPSSVVDGFMQSLQAMDFEKMRGFVAGGDDSSITNPNNSDNPEMIRGMFAKLKYELGDTKVTGDTATVDAKITAVDMPQVMGKVFREAIALAFSGASKEQSGAMMEQSFRSAIGDPNVALTTTNTAVPLVKESGAWKVKPDEAFVNAISGNLGDFAKAMSSGTSDSASSQPAADDPEMGTINAAQADAEAKLLIELPSTRRISGLDITVNSYRTTTELDSDNAFASKPEPGEMYVIVNLTVKNPQDETDSFSPMFEDFTLYAGGGSLDQESALFGLEDELSGGNIPPGGVRKGNIAFISREGVEPPFNLSLETSDGYHASWVLPK